MADKPAVLKCPKCGYLPNLPGETCVQCGTRLDRVCGACRAVNPYEKELCEKCGAPLTEKARQAQEPPAPEPKPQTPAAHQAPRKLEMESLQDTLNEKLQSFRRRATPAPAADTAAPKPPPPGPAQKPAAATGAPKPGAQSGTSPFIADSSRLRKDPAPPPKPNPFDRLKRASGPAVILLLTVVLLSIVYMIIAPSIPKLRLTMTAKSYLSAISEGRYEKAYELLSSNSKSAISKDDFVKNSMDYYSKAPAWQFREVQVFTMDKDAAMIRYELKEGDAEWKHDYISFVREHNRWTRPYIWILFQPIEEAIKRQDFPQALFLAQKLYLTDPIDPRSSGYLCSSEFFMGLFDKAAESCKRTIDAAQTYPVGYSSDELYWFNLCYADSLRYLQRERVAIQEYEKLMKWPGLTPKEQCPLFLNRADSYVALPDYNRALQDVMSAEAVCAEPASKEEAKKRLNYLSGTATAEAIAFAQKSRFQQGMPPIAEARRQQLEALKAKLGPANARYLPKDRWIAAHIKGPEYRVFLRQEVLNPRTRRQETQDIFIFNVNLWSGKAKAEKAPPPPPPPGPPPARRP